MTIYGDGEQSRDFTYVANVVDATLLAADAEGAAGTVLNIATGGFETVNVLADTVGTLLGRPVERAYEPQRPGDVQRSWAEVALAREAIGFEPKIGFTEGLQRTIESLVEKGSG